MHCTPNNGRPSSRLAPHPPDPHMGSRRIPSSRGMPRHPGVVGNGAVSLTGLDRGGPYHGIASMTPSSRSGRTPTGIRLGPDTFDMDFSQASARASVLPPSHPTRLPSARPGSSAGRAAGQLHPVEVSEGPADAPGPQRHKHEARDEAYGLTIGEYMDRMERRNSPMVGDQAPSSRQVGNPTPSREHMARAFVVRAS